MPDQPSSEHETAITPDATPEVRPAGHIAPETPLRADETDQSPPPLEISAEPETNRVRVAPISEADLAEPAAVTQPVQTSELEKTVPAAPASALPKQRPASPTRSQPIKPQRKERYTLVTMVSAFRSLTVAFAAAVIVSTIFMWFTSPDFLAASVRGPLEVVNQTETSREIPVPPTAVPTPYWLNRIGIVAGHSGIATYGTTRGNVDPGATCDDGFYEADVVMKVAQQVVASLQGQGFTADLLEEFDLRLDGYKAAAFVSIHADSCVIYNDGFNHSGFKVAHPTERETARDQDLRLEDCMRNNYGAISGLQWAPGEITVNMTNYHAFHAVGEHPGIAQTTPAIILEVGHLSYDRDLLQNNTDKLAQGVVNGLLCFLRPIAQATNNAATRVPVVPSPTGKQAVVPTATVPATAKP